jgi:nicotinic acid mononucleotide adenylyltransferase
MEYDLSKYNNPLIIMYGGTFSPFTMYNLNIVETITRDIYNKNNGLRDIIFYFVPTHDKYKSFNISNKYIGGNSNTERINMLNIVCKHLNRENKGIYYKISTNEINEKKPLTTYDSIIQIQQNIVNNNKIIVNNDIKVILIERHVKDILNGKWKNALSLLSKNIIVIPSIHTQLNIHEFEKEIKLSKMIANEDNMKNKEYLKLLSTNKNYILNKLTIYNTFTKRIFQYSPANTYDKIQEYYKGEINLNQLHEYVLPELSNYILKNNLYKSKLNKTVNKTKQKTKKKY